MVANGTKERGTSVRQLAKQMGVTEGALRYRLKAEEEADDGRPGTAGYGAGRLRGSSCRDPGSAGRRAADG